MTQPFSQEPVEKAIFEALLTRRRSLAETGDPVKAKRLLTEIKYLSRAADMLLYHSVSEHMNVACDEIIGGGSHQRVVLAEARLKPAFFGKAAEELKTLSSRAKEDTQAPFSQVNGGEAGTFPQDGGGAGTSYGGEAGTLYGGGAGVLATQDPKSSAEGGRTGTLSMDGWQAGVSIPDYGWHAGPSDDTKEEEKTLAQGWSPSDDVAVRMEGRQGTSPSLNPRRAFRFSRGLRSTVV